MAKTKYSVETYQMGNPHQQFRHISINLKNVAQGIAREWATKYPDELVYVSFFRAEDGQHGYINQQEGASLSGKPWMA